MMVHVATIGYAREPDFEVQAPGTPTTEETMAWAMLHRPVFHAACKEEGIDMRAAQRIVGAFQKKQGARKRRDNLEGPKREAKL